MADFGMGSPEELRQLKDVDWANYVQQEQFSPTHMGTTRPPAIRIWFLCSAYYKPQLSVLKRVVSVKHNGAASEIIS